ncbi:MAG: hypothetical protein AMXMBFR33_01380 [Candidatus Xenobia bacterium]
MSDLGFLRTLHQVVAGQLRASASFKSASTVSTDETGATVQLTNGAQVSAVPMPTGWHGGAPALLCTPEGRWSLASVLGRAPYVGGPEEEEH